jgi:hypothetical protein
MKRIYFILDGTLQVFRLGSTTNEKIAPSKKDLIVQSYTFSLDQLRYIIQCQVNNEKTSMKHFYSLDQANCKDCPFSANSGNGNCYTHKYMQYSGFISMLKSIAKEINYDISSIAEYSNDILFDIVRLSNGRYVRFGTYGEPSMHPYNLVWQVSKVAATWTGYTHQWFKKPEYAEFFMASTHSELQSETAMNRFKYRSFMISQNLISDRNYVNCPASKELNKTNCMACGLCSGTLGKGKKNVVIVEH